MKQLFWPGVLTSVLTSANLMATEIHVAPTGVDSNAGSAQQPVATLHQAQRLVRQTRQRQPTTATTVVIHDGTYYLSEPLVLTAADGGSAQAPVTWQAADGATPVISGGQSIIGWQERGNRWVATLPTVAAGEWYFRELLIGGDWAQRARWPNADIDYDDSKRVAIAAGDIEAAVDRGAEVADGEELPFIPWPRAKDKWTRDSCEIAFPAGTLPPWSNITDVELIYTGAWDMVIKRLAAQDGDTIVLQPPHAFYHQNITPNSRKDRVRWCHFENAPEMLDRPGEWYLDRNSGELSYMPLPGETIKQFNQSGHVVAPRLGPSVINIAGTAERPVRHLHITGVTIAHAAFDLPEQGYNGLQGGVYFSNVTDEQLETVPFHGNQPKIDHAIPLPGLPGAFSATAWQHGSLTSSFLQHCAATGIYLHEQCQDIDIRGNRFEELGGGGIRIGENWRYHYTSGGSYDPVDPALHKQLSARTPHRIVVSNNLIRDTGKHFWGSVGILSTAAFDLTISHNELSDLPYSGISSGWFWHDTRELPNGRITITNNRITNILQRLADGGGIYALGWHLIR